MIVVVAVVVLVASATGLALKINHDKEVRAQGLAADAALRAESDALLASADASIAKADAMILEGEVTLSYDSRLSNPKDSMYRPGVTVSSVTCITSGENLFDCQTQFSDARSTVYTILMAADRESWVVKAGQN